MRHAQAAFIGVLAVLAIGAASGRAAAQTASEPAHGSAADVRERLSGAPFHYAGGDEQRNALHEAIDRSTSSMNFIERPIARGRLRDRNVVEPSVVFQFQPGTVNVVLGGHTNASRDDFTPTPARAITGERMQLRQRVEGDRLVQSFVTSEGERRDEFVVSPDGRRLTMRVTVRSPKLRQPMQYQLNYAR